MRETFLKGEGEMSSESNVNVSQFCDLNLCNTCTNVPNII